MPEENRLCRRRWWCFATLRLWRLDSVHRLWQAPVGGVPRRNDRSILAVAEGRWGVLKDVIMGTSILSRELGAFPTYVFLPVTSVP